MPAEDEEAGSGSHGLWASHIGLLWGPTPVKVSIEELKSSPQQRKGFSFNETLAGLDAVKPVLGELIISLDAVGVRLSGRLQTLLKLSCHRCLKAYFQSLSVEIDERFVYRSDEEVPRERELLRDDFVEPIPVDGILDISDVVYQAVTLATPTFCLCGPECPGPPLNEAADRGGPLASGQEGERPMDPRWKNLKTLFPKEETGGKS